MKEFYKVTIESKEGLPVTKLKFKDFVSNDFLLNNKTCLLEVNLGEYLFFKDKSELIDYKLYNDIKLSLKDKIFVKFNR